MTTTYLLLFKNGNMDDQDQIVAWDAWIGKLAREGKFISGKPFGPSAKVISGSDRVVSDFTISEGDVVGYIIVQAESIDEVVEIAKHAPNLQSGGKVEIRSTIPPPQ